MVDYKTYGRWAPRGGLASTRFIADPPGVIIFGKFTA